MIHQKRRHMIVGKLCNLFQLWDSFFLAFFLVVVSLIVTLNPRLLATTIVFL
jgi:hypothetical protein